VTLLLPILVVAINYFRLPQTFWQQDEWAAFGAAILFWQRSFPLVSLFTSSSGVHITPLSDLIFFAAYHFFGLNFANFAWASLILHFFNSMLVYYLARLLFKKKWLALTAALLFAGSSLAHQAVTWLSTSANTQGAALFILLAMILILKKRPWWAFFALFLALGFKETGAFLFILLPILYFSKKILAPWLTLVAFYFGMRVWLLFNTVAPLSQTAGLTQPVKTTYLYRLVFLPIRIIPQSFISAGQIIRWAQGLVRQVYPHYLVNGGVPNPFVVESIAFDFVCFLFLLLFLLISLKFFKKSRVFWLSTSLIILSGLPLIFIPGRAGYVSMLEPRHLYLAGIGSSLILAMLLTRLKNKVLIFLALILILFSHGRIIQHDFDSLLANSRLRKSILTQIKSEHPTLPEKVIFYTESDTAYYGLADEEKILPFQSGLGQTLLVWFYDAEKFPPCFYEDVFLYKIESQGYRECQGRGFGYFRKYDDLLMTLQQKHLPAESVIAYRFSSQDNSLVDTSQEVWHELKASSFAAGL